MKPEKSKRNARKRNRLQWENARKESTAIALAARRMQAPNTPYFKRREANPQFSFWDALDS